MKDDFGNRVFEARRLAGLNQGQLALLTGISQPTLSRIEAGVGTPGFDDICAIARATHAPLLYLATGYGQSGLGTAVLVAQLHAYGLRDMDTPKSPILGESRTIEELIAAAAKLASPRIIEAVPGLLLRNDFSTTELRVFATRHGVRHRVGWLAEVAYSVAGTRGLVDAVVRPHVQERLERVFRSAWQLRRRHFKLKGARDWDALHRPLPGDLDERTRALKRWATEAPPLARKWRIADDTPQERFIERALGILRG